MEFHQKAMPGVITTLEHAKRERILVGGVTLDATSFGGPEMNRERRAAKLYCPRYAVRFKFITGLQRHHNGGYM